MVRQGWHITPLVEPHGLLLVNRGRKGRAGLVRRAKGAGPDPIGLCRVVLDLYEGSIRITDWLCSVLGSKR